MLSEYDLKDGANEKSVIFLQPWVNIKALDQELSIFHCQTLSVLFRSLAYNLRSPSRIWASVNYSVSDSIAAPTRLLGTALSLIFSTDSMSSPAISNVAHIAPASYVCVYILLLE